MKNFKKRINAKNEEIFNKFKTKNKIILFGYNKISIYFFKNNISNIFALDKNFVEKVENKHKDMHFLTTEEIESECIIINCITGIDAGLTSKRLKSFNNNVFSWIEIKNAFELRDFSYWYLVEFDKFFFDNVNKFNDLFKKISDFRSRKEFLKILSYKVTGCENVLSFSSGNASDQYFPEFIKFNQKSVLVDVGAYDGDTIKNFIRTKKKFKNILAFEPDKQNFERLKKNFINDKRITFFNKALGSGNTLKKFNSLQNKSKFDKNGNHFVSVVSLDSLNIIPEFIKVDIEGGEKEFILGSKNTIAKYKPQLAICVYHKPEDFFYLTDLILSINKKYKVYFRHHSHGFTESVMYFI